MGIVKAEKEGRKGEMKSGENSYPFASDTVGFCQGLLNSNKMFTFLKVFML